MVQKYSNEQLCTHSLQFLQTPIQSFEQMEIN